MILFCQRPIKYVRWYGGGLALFNDSFVYNYSLKPVVSIRTLNSPQNRHERQRICKSICTNGVSLVGEVVAVVRKVYTEKKVCLVQADFDHLINDFAKIMS